MNREQVINRLKDLMLERKSFITGDYYDEAYKKDVQALEYAIKELERTAQEVPVQEQSNKLHLFIVKNNLIQLDDLKLKGVISYTLQKTSRLDLQELTLKMQVCKTKIDS